MKSFCPAHRLVQRVAISILLGVLVQVPMAVAGPYQTAASGPAGTSPRSDSQPPTDYDPLDIGASPAKPIVVDDEVVDDARDRTIPVRIYLPAGLDEPAAVLLFSHGLGGARDNNPYLARHWTARGYVCVFLQHPGSDESVWKDKRLGERMVALKKAASMKNFAARVDDVKRVLDQLETWEHQPDHRLHGKLDLKRIGMSGHSFGARTTQAVSGQSFPLIRQKYTDKRIKAAVAFSPSAVKRGDNGRAFQSVAIPWMLMTGTHDESMISDERPEQRTKVYPALPDSIDKYELVLHDAEHSAFSDRRLPGDRKQRNPNHHRVILALTTAFWDAHLKDDRAAYAWLHGKGARSIIESKDRWQTHRAK